MRSWSLRLRQLPPAVPSCPQVHSDIVPLRRDDYGISFQQWKCFKQVHIFEKWLCAEKKGRPFTDRLAAGAALDEKFCSRRLNAASAPDWLQTPSSLSPPPPPLPSCEVRPVNHVFIGTPAVQYPAHPPHISR